MPRRLRKRKLDRISNLPDHVIDQILLRLTIRDAVRTSVLSTSWRYKWATLPSLVFEGKALSVSSSDERRDFAKRLVSVIDHVLLLHIGPIQKFRLDRIDFLPVNSIDRWILHLSRSTIKELMFDPPFGCLYKMPSSLYSCQHLTRLELYFCSLRPPSTFQGFVHLRILHFWFVILPQDGYEKLISSCPLLESLKLIMPPHIYDLVIDAPNLKSFEFGGKRADVTLANTVRLEEARILSGGLKTYVNLLKCFAKQPNLQRLELGHGLMECLRNGTLPRDLPKVYANLHRISIMLHFDCLQEILAVICFLQSVPNLQQLNISSILSKENEGANANFWEAANRNYSFTQLRHVRVSDILGTRYEMDLISYILLLSPVLEGMIVVPNLNCRNKRKLIKDLLRFKRASEQADITLDDADPSTQDTRFFIV